MYYAVWEPGFPVELGDFGVMNGNIFVHQGNIKDIEELKDFEIKKRIDDTVDEKFFTSKSGVQFELKPKMKSETELTSINASLEISFTKEKSVFFNAAGCQFEMIENKFEIGQKLVELYKQNSNRWKREFVLVTDRVIAKRALILISTSRDYSIKFEADSNLPMIDLASASLGLNMTSQKSSGYKVVTEEGLIPLIGLSKIQSSFLWFGDDFKPLSKGLTNMMLESIRNSEYIQTEQSKDELIFAQFTGDLHE